MVRQHEQATALDARWRSFTSVGKGSRSTMGSGRCCPCPSSAGACRGAGRGVSRVALATAHGELQQRALRRGISRAAELWMGLHSWCSLLGNVRTSLQASEEGAACEPLLCASTSVPVCLLTSNSTHYCVVVVTQSP